MTAEVEKQKYEIIVDWVEVDSAMSKLREELASDPGLLAFFLTLTEEERKVHIDNKLTDYIVKSLTEDGGWQFRQIIRDSVTKLRPLFAKDPWNRRVGTIRLEVTVDGSPGS